MALFSWFIGNESSKKIQQKNTQLDEKVESFNANTMWPIAKVRRNTIVKQQQFTNSTQDKKHQEVSPISISLPNKES